MPLEATELNHHHRMAPVVSFLRDLNERSKADRPGAETPKWMVTLAKTLLSEDLHSNVSLFIISLVINIKDVLQPYAQSW